MRAGEMAALGEMPFGRYYGSVDATPLFVMLAAAYYERTGDDDAAARSCGRTSSARSAGSTRHGDPDGDGFVEYERRSPDGLQQPGLEGLARLDLPRRRRARRGPIALCEVQGYVYAARRGLARPRAALGERASRRASHDEAADALRARFEATFWCDDLGTYALALDGDKRPCRVRSSNAGHALFTGIATRAGRGVVARDAALARHVLGLGHPHARDRRARYNPMSYHNGSVWPHDNALIARGPRALRRRGLRRAASCPACSTRAAASTIARLPELFCGFDARGRRGADALSGRVRAAGLGAAAAFLLLQAALGLAIDAPAGELRFVRPALPSSLEQLVIRDLRIGEAVVDVRLERTNRSTSVSVLRCDGPLRVLVEI